MLLAKLIGTNDTKNRDVPAHIGDSNSSPSLARKIYLTPRRSRRALVTIAALVCLMTMSLPTYAGIAFAQEKTGQESLVEGEVSNLNTYWEEQFRLLGYTYSPAKLMFLHDQLVLGLCGPTFTELGPAYCSYDETFYYPVEWIDPATGLRLEEYGEAAVEMVVAHEMAHHVQSQMQKFGIEGVEYAPGTQMELEADCFAGVYAKQAFAQPGGLEDALTALGVAGGPGHGSSEQRVAAFELGYSTGDYSSCLAMDEGDSTTI